MAPWKLSCAAVIGWCVWIALWCMLMTAWLTWFVTEEVRKPDAEKSSPYTAEAIARFGLTIFAGVAAGTYVHTSAIAPRPSFLHRHGLILMLLLPEVLFAAMDDQLLKMGAIDGDEKLFIAGQFAKVLLFALYGVRRAMFIRLTIKKMAALGPPPGRFHGIRPWGWLGIFFTVLVCGSVVALRTWVAGILLAGVPLADLGTVLETSVVHQRVMSILRHVLLVSLVGLIVSSFCITFVAWFLLRKTLLKLRGRQVVGEKLSHARRILLRHGAGVAASLITSNVALITSYFVASGAWEPDLAYALPMIAYSIDVAGDLIGILLFSGIGTLLIREDKDAGDISGHIRGVLHSAVLTSRADTVFEGSVRRTPSDCCIVSFPGKFFEEWNALTWLCEQGEISSACVFLPTSDPEQRFGQHVRCPEAEGDCCWCHSLYGEPKPWGCLWFEAWRANVLKAVALDLDLVVVFFPGQVGRGLVDWEKLSSSDLWDGTGLGGSQKAEVAYLQKMGYHVIQECLNETRNRISGKKIKLRPMTSVAPTAAQHRPSEGSVREDPSA